MTHFDSFETHQKFVAILVNNRGEVARLKSFFIPNIKPFKHMKKLMLTLFVLTFLYSEAFSQTTDIAAIKKTIEAEKAASDTGDYKAYLSHWVKAPYSSFLYNGILLTGDALWKTMDERWAKAKARKVNNTRSDWNIRINGDAAYVTFNQHSEIIENNKVIETVEGRFLEKIKNEWKIVNMTAITKAKQ